jgi:GTP-binding protein Era
VAIIGAPNAGKSSLMNRFLGQKVAIVTKKPQTTRHRILGVLTWPSGQIAFCDTPGIHDSPKALNREMVSRALSALSDSDVCLWLVDGASRGPDHRRALEMVMARRDRMPLVAAINKADLLDPPALAELSGQIAGQASPDGLLGVSAMTGQGLRRLRRTLAALLPEGPPLFEEDALTDQSLRTIAAEHVREAVFELTRQEIPYSTAVTVDEFLEPGPGEARPLFRISATIHVERDSQKRVMVGRNGSMLRDVGRRARLGLEAFLGTPVFLSLFVRITKDWSGDARALEEFGYRDGPGRPGR